MRSTPVGVAGGCSVSCSVVVEDWAALSLSLSSPPPQAAAISATPSNGATKRARR